jgi:hypothetical protein
MALTHARGVVELYDQRRRRQHRDYLVTLVAVTLMLGFLFGLFVGAVIVSRQTDDQPREEMFHEQPQHSERQPDLAGTQDA